MAEEQDQSQKTEEPTQRRLTEAREKGQVAVSREVNNLFMILAATILVVMVFPGTFRDLALLLQTYIGFADAFPLDHAGSARAIYGRLFLALVGALALPFAILLALAFGAGVIQNGFLVTVEAIKPKLSKVSLVEGAKRLFSIRALVEFAKGIVKLAIVGAAACFILWPSLVGLDTTPAMAVVTQLEILYELAQRLFIGVLAVVAAIAAFDFLYQKQSFLKRMRMSHQELKDEFKQTEGDPMIKNRLRQIRMERARRRMMAAVPESDVVITNPTHFAVALKWKPEEMNAPRVAAKGVDHLALKIREVAEANRIPIVENPPLAQALYHGVELDREIPAEHYKAVAEIIGYVLRLKKKRGRPA